MSTFSRRRRTLCTRASSGPAAARECWPDRQRRAAATRTGTCEGKSRKRARRVKVSADGAGVVSHARVGLLREVAQYTGLVEAITKALVDTYKGVPVHAPGRVFTDSAVAVADGADAISGVSVVAHRQEIVRAGGLDATAVVCPDSPHVDSIPGPSGWVDC